MNPLARAIHPGRYVPPRVMPPVAMPALDAGMPEERLPFTVRVARTDADLAKAVAVRHAAYARHLPELAESLRSLETIDEEPGVAVLLAESKLDGSALGTLRIQTNSHMPLMVEQSVTLPRWLRDCPMAEVTRLGIVGGSIGRLVKVVLIKAAFEYCEQDSIDWAVIAARAPLDRMYEQMLFEDLFPEQGFMPMRHIGNVPHRVMGFEIETGEQRWSEANHPLLTFFRGTHHPDINIDVQREYVLGGLFPDMHATRLSPPLGRRPV